MELDEAVQRLGTLKSSLESVRWELSLGLPSAPGEPGPSFAEIDRLEAWIREVEWEIEAHLIEREARDRGEPAVHYTVQVAGQMQFRPSLFLPAGIVRCPECGADTGLTAHAMGDETHRTWASCPQGHEWPDALITYPSVRRLIAASHTQDAHDRSDLELWQTPYLPV